jgi:hypothetical protein
LTAALYIVSWEPVKLYAGLQPQSVQEFKLLVSTQHNIPLHISTLLHTDQDLFRADAIVALAELRSNAVVGALQDLARGEMVSVHRKCQRTKFEQKNMINGRVSFERMHLRSLSPVTVFVATAVRLDACDVALHTGDGDIEVVAAAAARATSFPAGDVPVPARGDFGLAGSKR